MRRWVRAEAQSMRCGCMLERRMHCPGLHRGAACFDVERDDLVHEAGEIHDNSGAHSVARDRGASTSRCQRRRRFGACRDGREHFVDVMWTHDDLWNDAIQRGVRAVQRAVSYTHLTLPTILRV